MNRTRLRIMVYRHSAFYSPVLAALTQGFLQDEGFDPVYFIKPTERNLYEMFALGEVDVMQAAVSTSWDPLSRGVTDIPRHFAQINERDGFFIVSRTRPERPFRWSDLEGRRLVADHAQQPLAMLRYALHRQGVNWDRVVAVRESSPDAMERAFREGKGDYVHLQGPAPQQLEAEGMGHVVASVGEALPPVAFSTLMAQPSFLKGESLEPFMRAYRRALEWVNAADPAEVASSILPMFPGASADPMAAAVRSYQKIRTWRPDPQIPQDQYETAMDAFLHSGVFNRRFPYADVVWP